MIDKDTAVGMFSFLKLLAQSKEQADQLLTKWNRFDRTPPEGDTFLIKQDGFKIYFGRVVDGRILTSFVFQNINGLTKNAVAESGKPIDKWLEMQQPQGSNKTELLWAVFNWQA
jgi:hypothetical protein